MKRFFRRIGLPVLAMLPLLWFGCSGSDSGEAPGPGTDPTPDPPQEQTATLAELKTFLSDRIAACEYCRGYTVANGIFTVDCYGNNRCTVRKERAVLLTIGDDGCWAADGASTGVPAREAEMRRRNPAVGVTAAGNLTVDGADLGVAAGSPLRCIADTKKHLCFYFTDGVVALGSELYGNYNPVLPKIPAGRKLRILFIGNSFTVDATEHLPGILKAAGADNVELVRAYHGGYTLPEYNDNYALSDICARYDSPAGSGKWNGTATLDTSLERVLVDGGPYDVVVLQEHTGKSYAWEWTPVFREALAGLTEKIQDLQPKHRPTIVYLLAQVYGAYNTTILPQFGSRARMFETLTTQAKRIMSETSIDCLVSSATALENLRTTRVNADNGMDLTRDGYHMDYGISRYAAACAVFEAIVTPCTGITLDGNTYRYDKSETVSPHYSTPVTDDNAPIAVRAAVAAVEEPFEVTDLSAL